MIRSLASQGALRCLPLASNSLPGVVSQASTAGRSMIGPQLANHLICQQHGVPHNYYNVVRHASAQAQVHEEADDPPSVTEPASQRKVRPRGGGSRPKLNPIIITERAAERIQELLSGPSADGAIGIRLGVKRRGCNGLSYTLNYAFERPEKDEEMEGPLGIKVFIEPMALFNVVGTKMDYEETELSSEFTFNNPNSKGECGCGESFNV